MLKREQNELLTQTGPGTPMGELFRRYWIPALLAAELPGNDCPPVRVKLLSERLIAFRDSSGKLGLIDDVTLSSFLVMLIAIGASIALYLLVQWTGRGKFLFERPSWAHLPGTKGSRSYAAAAVPAE